MIQLKYTNGQFELTDKKTVLTLEDSQAKINNQSVTELGEYEIGGVEFVYGEHGILIVWEHLQFVYAFSGEAPTAFEKDQFSSCDVLLLKKNEELYSKTTLEPLISAYEPQVIVAGPSTLEEAYITVSKASNTSVLKLSAQTLPVEGRETYILE